jgi:uncharacterized cupin superfamily protein/glyoxylase-like metal-dependent hydrolase (beta-lactamase superfamily II)
MQQTTIEGITMWSVWQPDRNVFFNSYFIEHADGNLVVDPLALDERDAAEIERRGGVAWAIVTNRDHERGTANLVERFSAKVAAAAGDASSLHVRVDRLLEAGDTLGPARVIALEGLKTAGEIALSLRGLQTVIVGDALWGDPAGSLRLMPDDKLIDPRRAALSLRALRGLRPKHVLVGDGAPIFERGFEALNTCLDAREGVPVNVVNFDELAYSPDGDDPPGYKCMAAEVGFLLGASVLGYQTAHVPPGESICPLHWHAGDEELFIVWQGTPTLLSPRGEVLLRRGDIVCFATGPRGAHKLVNRGTEPFVVLMIANDAPVDACFYPDSRKVLVSPARVMVRSEPNLDYYEGETV